LRWRYVREGSTWFCGCCQVSGALGEVVWTSEQHPLFDDELLSPTSKPLVYRNKAVLHTTAAVYFATAPGRSSKLLRSPRRTKSHHPLSATALLRTSSRRATRRAASEGCASCPAAGSRKSCGSSFGGYCGDCTPGKFVKDGACVACPSSYYYYQPEINEASCIGCGSCPAGSRKGCGIAAGGFCSDCIPGQYNDRHIRGATTAGN
jgi:hypothetical protein